MTTQRERVLASMLFHVRNALEQWHKKYSAYPPGGVSVATEKTLLQTIDDWLSVKPETELRSTGSLEDAWYWVRYDDLDWTPAIIRGDVWKATSFSGIDLGSKHLEVGPKILAPLHYGEPQISTSAH